MINTINGILEAAKGGKTGVIAVAAAHDQPVIEAVVEARKEGIATPILVGHVDEIKDMLSGLGENPTDYEIVAGDSDTDCAAKAVALCAEGKEIVLEKIEFAKPVIDVAIEPKTKAEQDKMSLALTKLAAEAPTFQVSTAHATGQTIIAG